CLKTAPLIQTPTGLNKDRGKAPKLLSRASYWRRGGGLATRIVKSKAAEQFVGRVDCERARHTPHLQYDQQLLSGGTNTYFSRTIRSFMTVTNCNFGLQSPSIVNNNLEDETARA